MKQKIDTRDAILEAATSRILHYGYAKTTMSEIARDCDMSAGNIYRFFASKVDIAEALARNFAGIIFQEYAAIARDKSKHALERMKSIFASEMERTHALMTRNGKLLEIANVLSAERPEFAREELAQARVHLVQVLKDGVAAGEIRPLANVDETALFIQAAMTKFCVPELLNRSPIEELRAEFEGVFSLICTALRT